MELNTIPYTSTTFVFNDNVNLFKLDDFVFIKVGITFQLKKLNRFTLSVKGG